MVGYWFCCKIFQFLKKKIEAMTFKCTVTPPFKSLVTYPSFSNTLTFTMTTLICTPDKPGLNLSPEWPTSWFFLVPTAEHQYKFSSSIQPLYWVLSSPTKAVIFFYVLTLNISNINRSSWNNHKSSIVFSRSTYNLCRRISSALKMRRNAYVRPDIFY